MLDRVASMINNNPPVKNSSSSDSSVDLNGINNPNLNPTSDENRPLNQNEKEKVTRVVDGLNEILLPSHTSLKFEYHEKLNEYYVTLVDDATKEVVKEIPSKKMLDFYAAMTEAIGLMIDKKI